MALALHDRSMEPHQRPTGTSEPPGPAMDRKVRSWLPALVGVLALLVAGLGLLWHGVSDPVAVSSIRGQAVELHGNGLYRYDTVFAAATNRSSDLVTLLLALPLLGWAAALCRRGSTRGRLLLLGVLGYLLYSSASYALGAVAYNPLFLLYVAYFSASLFAFVLTFADFARHRGAALFSDDIPRRLPGIFMVASSIATLGIWLIEPIAALRSGDFPAGLGTYTTLFTHAFDLAIIVPAALIAGVMILRGRPLGYVVASSLLVLEALLLPLITVATVMQVSAGVTFTSAEMVGPIAGFTLLAVVAIAVLRIILRHTRSWTAPDARAVGI